MTTHGQFSMPPNWSYEDGEKSERRSQFAFVAALSAATSAVNGESRRQGAGDYITHRIGEQRLGFKQPHKANNRRYTHLALGIPAQSESREGQT